MSPSSSPQTASGVSAQDLENRKDRRRERALKAPIPFSSADDPELIYRVLVAELAGRRGNMSLALQQYLIAAESSNDVRLARRATRIALFGHAWPQASQGAARWLELDPDGLEVHRILAVVQLKQGKTEQALRAFKKMIALSSTDSVAQQQVLSLVAAILLQEKKPTVALPIVTELLKRHQESAVLHFTRARFELRNKDQEAALASLDKALLLEPSDAEALLLRAKLLLNMGRAEQAIAGVSDAIEKSPENRSLRLGYARLLVKARQYERASVQLKALFERYADQENVVFALGLLAVESRRYDEAAEYFIQLLTLGQRTDEANYYLGRIADSRRDYENALGYYQNVKEGEDRLDAQVRMAEMLAKLGQTEAARLHLKRLRLMHTEASYAVRFYLTEGEILRAAGEHGQALTLFDEALQAQPKNVDLLYARALVAEKLQKFERFETDLKQLLTLEPENAHGLNALGYFLIEQTGRLQEAGDYIRRAFVLSPGDPAVIDSLGWWHYRSGDRGKALELLSRAHKLLEDPEIAAHLGEVLWVSGDKQRANTVWNHALKSAPDDDILKEAMQRLKP
ncbi:MAG: tetratricopeptide repeat protein [Gammaproteobacteria bacterium]|nr:tetratricopeptide repeat protein [Gammaproteobacteria bacterium]